jgi:hypothetical protein
MVYIIGQLIHDHRSGLVSWCGALLGSFVAVYLFDYSYQPWVTVLVLALPIFFAAFGYNLPVPRTIVAAKNSASPSELVRSINIRANALEQPKKRSSSKNIRKKKI